MSFDPPTLPPAGWYPDPEHPGRQRFWNGSTWDEAGYLDAYQSGYPDVGEWLSEAFRSMWRHVRAELVLALLTAVPASIMIAVALRVAVEDLLVVDNEIVGWDNDRIPALVVFGVVATVLFLVGTLASTWLGLRIADRNDGSTDPSIPADLATGSELRFALSAIGAALRATPRAIGWFLLPLLLAVPAVAVLAVVALAPPLLILVVLAAIPLGIWIVVRLSFTFVAVVDRRGNPYARSWSATRHRFWSTFGRLLLLALITSAISIAVNAVTSPFGSGASTFGEESVIEIDDDGDVVRFEVDALRPSTTDILVGAVGAVAVGIFATGTSAIAFGRLYRNGGVRAEP